jgi:phosphorylcholine metabolism protein LicD
MMVTGIVLSAIIPTSLDVLNAIDVASHVLVAVAVAEETVAVEISTEVLEIDEMVEEEMVTVEEGEISLIVTKLEQNQKKIIFANQRVKEQGMLIIMHQNLSFHENLVEIVMIK